MGSWFGWTINKERQIDLADDYEKHLFEAGIAFAKSVQAGEVEIKQPSQEQTSVNNMAEPDDEVPF